MLKNAAELLDALLERERAILDKSEIKHAPTIGGMYEELTRSSLEKYAIPSSINLSVSSGFIRFPNGSLSSELDCAIVIGKGEDQLHSPKKIFRMEQVVAVIQVKKNLHGAEITQGHDNLREVMSQPYYDSIPLSVVRQTFQSITGVPFPADPNSLPPNLQAIYHLLVVESATPVRILLGYHGYTTEAGFREGLIKHLEDLVAKKGGGPLTIPNLILNSNVAAVKGVGIPWTGPMVDGQWHVLLTYAGHSVGMLLLEQIWTKLNMLGLLPADQLPDQKQAFRIFYAVELDKSEMGWRGTVFTNPKILEQQLPPSEDWNPIELTITQFALLGTVLKLGKVEISAIPEDPVVTRSDIGVLTEHRLAAISPDNPDWLIPLTEECRIAKIGTQFFAGEDSDGRFSRWLERMLLHESK